MATITVTPIRTFTSGETVTPTKLNELSQPTVALTAGTIVDADVSASAAIAHSKLANITAGQVLLGNASNVPTATAITGDVTVTNAGVTAIGNAKVTAPMLDGAQTGSAPIYGCRAWVNFDGTAGTTVGGEFRCTIRASGNVTKVVRTATGQFTIHFSTAMPDANFAVIGSRGSSSSASYPVTGSFEVASKTTSTVAIETEGYGNTWSASLTNSAVNDVAIFR